MPDDRNGVSWCYHCNKRFPFYVAYIEWTNRTNALESDWLLLLRHSISFVWQPIMHTDILVSQC